MKTKLLIALAAIAAGYLAGKQLRNYQPFKSAYLKGASAGT
jgi:hypothetical protein